MEFSFRTFWDYKGKRGSSALWHEAFTRSISDWRTAFERIVNQVLNPYIQAQFSTQGAISGEPWAPLAESTVKRRGSAGPILTLTGALKESFQTQILTERSLVWGSDVSYGIFHQTGTGKGFDQRSVPTGSGTGRGMARRPPLDFSPNDPRSAAMQRIIMAEGAQRARAAGFRVGGRGTTPAEAVQIGDIALSQAI